MTEHAAVLRHIYPATAANCANRDFRANADPATAEHLLIPRLRSLAVESTAWDS